MRLPHYSLLSVLTALAAVTAKGAPVDADRLRKAAPLPRANLSLNFGFSATEMDTRTQPARIPELVAKLKLDFDDAETHLALAKVFRANCQDQQARDEFALAVRLLTDRAKSNPPDISTRIHLGEALAGAKESEKALDLLRAITKEAPKEAAGWSAFASAARQHAWQALALDSAGHTDLNDVLQQLQSKPVPPAQLDEFLKSIAEAEAALDMAVKLAPKSPDVYMDRAGFGMDKGFGHLIASVKRGDKDVDPSRVMVTMFMEAGANQIQAARLLKSDPLMWSSVAMTEIFCSLATHPDIAAASNPNDGYGAAAKALTGESKQRCDEAMDALRRLAEAGETAHGKGAVALAMCSYMLGRDMKPCETALRRAIADNPDNVDCWETLLLLLGQLDRWKDAAQAAKEYASKHDSVRARLLAAKAFQRSGDWDQAVGQVMAAKKLSPNDAMVMLALIVVDLKRPQSPDNLASIGKTLDSLEKSMPKDTPDAIKTSVSLTRAVYLGLQGKESEGRELVRKALESDRSDKALTELLAALGG